jgi:heme/copper-type cytochrome/quinol oxidase subunit 1
MMIFLSSFRHPGDWGISSFPSDRARDVAFPRLNLLSYWVFVGGILVVLDAGKSMDTGWTFYTPIPQKPEPRSRPFLSVFSW